MPFLLSSLDSMQLRGARKWLIDDFVRLTKNETGIRGRLIREAAVEKMEAQLGFLYRSLGIATQEAPGWKASPELIELVRKGDKLAAIKAFREESGASLKDAKEFIESLVN